MHSNEYEARNRLPDVSPPKSERQASQAGKWGINVLSGAQGKQVRCYQFMRGGSHEHANKVIRVRVREPREKQNARYTMVQLLYNHLIND